MVVLGAILIWFGLSRGSGEVQGAAPSGEAHAEVPGGSYPSEAAPGDSSGEGGDGLGFAARERESLEPIPNQDPVASRGRYLDDDRGRDLDGDRGRDLDDEDESGELNDDRPGEASARSDEPEWAATEDQDGVLAPIEERSRAIDTAEMRPSASARDFEFRSGSADDSTRLATLLLEAWISEDAQDLLGFLQQGDGADLPMARRQLCAAFWEALVGQGDAARGRWEAIEGGEGVTSSQLGFLAAALDPPGERAVPSSAASSRPEPLAYAMRMMLLEDEARGLLRERDYARSAVAWSDLLRSEVNAPWAPHRAAILGWGKELERAQQNHRFASRGVWPSIEERVQNGDSLVAIRKRVIRRRPDLHLCTGLIAAVNGITGYIQDGEVLRIPLDEVNVIVDLDSRVLLYLHGDEIVQLWQIGIGKENHDTPIGEFTVGDKIERPAHTTRGLPYGHPDNPLGSRWLALYRDGRKTSYGIHGTSDPDGVGGEVSLGCVRMRNEDVNEIFEILPQGSRVVIQR